MTAADDGRNRLRDPLSLLPRSVRIPTTTVFEFLRWTIAGFTGPAPALIKRRVLRRHGVPGGAWVETGTFRGDTTAFLGRAGSRVESLEPMPELCAAARRRFAGRPNITVHELTSEQGLATVIARLEGPINFWLDGHYSGEGTFAGADDTPILRELDVIGAAIAERSLRVAILIDDVRLFLEEREERPGGSSRGYPPLSTLTDWAERQGFEWLIEHDILILVAP